MKRRVFNALHPNGIGEAGDRGLPLKVQIDEMIQVGGTCIAVTIAKRGNCPGTAHARSDVQANQTLQAADHAARFDNPLRRPPFDNPLRWNAAQSRAEAKAGGRRVGSGVTAKPNALPEPGG